MLTRVRKHLPHSLKLRIWRTRLFVRSLAGALRMSPSFIIIGAQKGGTTSLYNYLIQHPQILPALEKEVRFFDYKYGRGMSWYKAHFPLLIHNWFAQARWGRNVIVGESTPNYFFNPRSPQRIFETLPNAKLIVLLRDPIERAYSHYQMSVRGGRETLSFADALEAEEERIAAELKNMIEDENFVGRKWRYQSYRTRGIYVDQLDRWSKLFSRDQFLLIKSDDLFTNPAKTVERVIRFLGLIDWEFNLDKIYNPGGDYPEIDPIIRQRLDRFYAPHNQRLFDSWGVDFEIAENENI